MYCGLVIGINTRKNNYISCFFSDREKKSLLYKKLAMRTLKNDWWVIKQGWHHPILSSEALLNFRKNIWKRKLKVKIDK